MAIEQDEAERVGREGKRPDRRHRRGRRQRSCPDPYSRFGEDAYPDPGHQQTLDERGARSPSRASVEDEEAEGVDEAIAQHVERVTQERRRPRPDPRAELDREHHQAGEQDDPQNAGLALAQRRQLQSLAFTTIAHESSSFRVSGGR